MYKITKNTYKNIAYYSIFKNCNLFIIIIRLVITLKIIYIIDIL